ncbi:MAG TPA: hypothetical protein VFP93_04985 [Gammaproteobacteria bacterium]|nr:hypothetical protein [Gammaproteobacteria bacterium]
MRTLNMKEQTSVSGGAYVPSENEIEDLSNSLGLGTWSTLFLLGTLEGAVVVLMEYCFNI